MRILISNDDGINADGINVLAEVFGEDNDILTVAPDSERSASGHSISIHNDISYVMRKVAGKEGYAISGTPADCVKAGILYFGKNVKFDLVLSGINNGPNLGSDVLYSGTVSAALEGVYLGVPSVAVSLSKWNCPKNKYLEAAIKVKSIIGKLLSVPLKNSAFNINYPADVPFAGVKVTRMGIHMYDDLFLDTEKGKRIRIHGNPLDVKHNDDDTDVELIKKGFVTVTPVLLDKNDYPAIEYMKEKALFE